MAARGSGVVGRLRQEDREFKDWIDYKGDRGEGGVGENAAGRYISARGR